MKVLFTFFIIFICSYTTITYFYSKETTEKQTQKRYRLDIAPDLNLSDYSYTTDEKNIGGYVKVIFGDENIYMSSQNIELKNLESGYLSYKVDYSYDYTDYSDHFIVFPLISFTGYVAKDEEGHDLNIYKDRNYYITVYLPKKSGTISVYFDPPIIWKIADVISLFTLLMIIILIWNKKTCDIFFKS